MRASSSLAQPVAAGQSGVDERTMERTCPNCGRSFHSHGGVVTCHRCGHTWGPDNVHIALGRVWWGAVQGGADTLNEVCDYIGKIVDLFKDPAEDIEDDEDE